MRSQPGDQVLIIDAGGGTIDISTYAILNNRPLQVEELCEPECGSDESQSQILCLKALILGLVQGGEFVTVRAREMIQGEF